MSQTQEDIYREFLNYDWSSFTEFQQGLAEIMDNYLDGMKEQDPLVTKIPASDQQQLTDQAKSFFYCSHTGNILNLDDFYQWKRHQGIGEKIYELPEEKEIEQPTNDTNNDNPPYSSNYQHLVELIVSGKPVPGIKQIPDTVLSEQSSTPQAKQRVKPWEKQNETATEAETETETGIQVETQTQ